MRLQLVLEKSVLVAPSEKVLVVAARAAAQMVGHGAGAAPSSHQHTNTLFFAKNSNLRIEILSDWVGQSVLIYLNTGKYKLLFTVMLVAQLDDICYCYLINIVQILCYV